MCHNNTNQITDSKIQLYASYPSWCKSSSCRAMEQHSSAGLAGYAGRYPATSGNGQISKI